MTLTLKYLYAFTWFTHILENLENTVMIIQISGAKTIKKNENTNTTQSKYQTHRAKQYEVTSFLSTDCELSTEICSKNVYSLCLAPGLEYTGIPSNVLKNLLTYLYDAFTR